MQEYKSLSLVAMICGALVNTQTHSYTISTASWANIHYSTLTEYTWDTVHWPKPTVTGLSTSTLGGMLSAVSVVAGTVEDFLRPTTAAVAKATGPNIVRLLVGDCRTSVTQANIDTMRFNYTQFSFQFLPSKNLWQKWTVFGSAIQLTSCCPSVHCQLTHISHDTISPYFVDGF